MFRYTVNSDFGGCVLATCKAEAGSKVRAAYCANQDIKKITCEDLEIVIWTDDEISADVVEIYP